MSLEIAAEMHPQPPHTAVCISGESRTFLDARIQDGLRWLLWHDGYDAFLSSDLQIGSDDPRLAFQQPNLEGVLPCLYPDKNGL